MNKNCYFSATILVLSISYVVFSHASHSLRRAAELAPSLLRDVPGSIAGTSRQRTRRDLLRASRRRHIDPVHGLGRRAVPGAGQGQACAWRHPFWALDGGGAWNISGGDTIIVAAGSYRMGFGADNTGWCDEWGAFDCHLPPLPSGPDPSTPTRVMGEGWDAGCPSAPELWGAERPWQVLNLEGSDHVEIRCLEITDRSGCVDGHSNSQIACQRDVPPYGDQADCGIRALDSEDVLLKDLNIHGAVFVRNPRVGASRLDDRKRPNRRQRLGRLGRRRRGRGGGKLQHGGHCFQKRRGGMERLRRKLARRVF